MKVCPDCCEAPAPDQRSAAKYGRCSNCLTDLKHDRYQRAQLVEADPYNPALIAEREAQGQVFL